VKSKEEMDTPMVVEKQLLTLTLLLVLVVWQQSEESAVAGSIGVARTREEIGEREVQGVNLTKG
jgi:hypothetical protein